MEFPSFNLMVFLLGCAGGLVPDVLRIILNRYDPQLPSYFKTVSFWLGAVFMVALGGFVSWILQPTSVRDALIYGYVAPELLSRIAGSVKGSTIEGALPESMVFKLKDWWGK
jgi:hypothetical protein